MSLYNYNVTENAMRFAMEKHKGQTRDDGFTPYHSHLYQVCQVLSQVTTDEDILAAAWLHDTLEDTATTFDELVEYFGKRIANLVLEVTHDPRVQGKTATFSRLKSREAIMLKFADRLSNISEMESWNPQRQQAYLNKSKFWTS